MSVCCCLALFCFTKLLPCTAPYCPVIFPYGSAFGSNQFWRLYCRCFHSRLRGLLFCCPGSNFAPLYSKNKAMRWPAGNRTRFRLLVSQSHILEDVLGGLLCCLNPCVRCSTESLVEAETEAFILGQVKMHNSYYRHQDAEHIDDWKNF